MLCSIRRGKMPGGASKLKASAQALPKHEPWMEFVGRVPTPLPQIVLNSSARLVEAITSRGERGDGRELRPSSFTLVCPKCGSVREAARVTLYCTRARGLNCTMCRLNTSSTRWMCQHAIPWQRCPEHRAGGFRCGSHRGNPGPWDARAPPTSIQPLLKDKLHLARLKRLARIGPLGSSSKDPQAHDMCKRAVARNSGRCPTKTFKKKKRKIGVMGNAQPPKGEGRDIAWPRESHQSQKRLVLCEGLRGELPRPTKIPRIVSKQPDIQRDPSCRTLRSDNPGDRGSDQQAKRPKVAHVSTSRCKGLCPKVGWSIDQYCEACHG
jgi:hypothetical protein